MEKKIFKAHPTPWTIHQRAVGSEWADITDGKGERIGTLNMNLLGQETSVFMVDCVNRVAAQEETPQDAELLRRDNEELRRVRDVYLEEAKRARNELVVAQAENERLRATIAGWSATYDKARKERDENRHLWNPQWAGTVDQRLNALETKAYESAVAELWRQEAIKMMKRAETEREKGRRAGLKQAAEKVRAFNYNEHPDLADEIETLP